MAWLMTGDGVDPPEWWMQSERPPDKARPPVSAKIAKHSAAPAWMDYTPGGEKKLHAPHVKNCTPRNLSCVSPRKMDLTRENKFNFLARRWIDGTHQIL